MVPALLRRRDGRLLLAFTEGSTPENASDGALVLSESDDHGRTWTRGDLVPGPQGGDECQAVELAGGGILMDFRQNSGPHRWQAESADGGKTWGAPRAGATVTPVACAIERLGRAGKPRRGDLLVWTGPAADARRHLVARSSTDEGKTFAGERTIYDSFAAYSDLTVLNDGSVGLIWERGVERSYQFLTFTRLDRKFLEGK
jgi:sialidase-1